MNNISPVMDIEIYTEDNYDQWVSARDLHEFLQAKKDFRTWVDQVNRMFDLEHLMKNMPRLTPLGHNYDYVVPIDTAIVIAKISVTVVDNNPKDMASLLWQFAAVTKLYKMNPKRFD